MKEKQKGKHVTDEENLSKEKLVKVIKEAPKKEKTTEEYQPYLYLYSAMNQPGVIGLVRSFCSEDEITDLPNTITSWQQARTDLERIVNQEAGIADNPQTYDIGQNQKLNDLKNDALFRNTFSNNPIEFKLVDIDSLVAIQRHVYIDYVNEIENIIPANPSTDDLIDICLPIRPTPPEPKVTNTGPGSWLFSSPSPDFRYIGGYLKERLTEDDLRYTQVSGFPVKAITLFVGYGGSPINVFHANNRLVLNNGFHRVFALRRKGITRIPVVVQQVANPEFEFPKERLGLSREYLLNDPRPILVKDFFTNGLTREFKRKKMITTVQVTAQGGAITFEV